MPTNSLSDLSLFLLGVSKDLGIKDLPSAESLRGDYLRSKDFYDNILSKNYDGLPNYDDFAYGFGLPTREKKEQDLYPKDITKQMLKRI